ncbi:MAG: tryptophan--tRNA ligase, partial [Opitutales bacterium]
GFKVSNESESQDIKFTHDGVRAQASINAGLLCYPVLMAADILLYNADLVPVGEDQRQHLELCRDLAGRFNQKYSETFTIPEPFVPPTGARIMSLTDPLRKMSKSDENEKATIFVLDEPDQIRKKIGSSVTDSGTEIKVSQDKPGVSNLLSIHSSLSGIDFPSLEDHFLGKGYGELKSEVSELLVETLRTVRESYYELINDKTFLDSVLKEGAQAAQKRAFKILNKVQRKIGLPDRPR